VSAYWERAIQGTVILVAIAADGIRHPAFRRLAGVETGGRPSVTR
jgi:ribose/xylose/arabinose/galactoside ABC-type transport system permease subunit